MPETGAWICGIGMMTPVGDCAAQTASSVRAGISRYQESAVYNRKFQPMTMALLPEEALPPLKEPLQLSGLTSRQARMLRLAEPALKEASQVVASLEQVPLFLATPEPYPDQPEPITRDFLDQLLLQVGVPFARAKSEVFPTGRAGGIQAIASAMSFLERDDSDCVLLGGVDSYLDLRTLGLLDQEGRVLAEGVMDGFAPGEGSAFLLLASQRGLQTLDVSPLALLHPASIQAEAGHRYSEEPYRGDALAEAVATALDCASTDEPIRNVLASLNGENYGAKEWGVAAVRNSAALDPEHRIEHPAQCFGDTGAAVAPLLLALAAMGMNQGHIAGPSLVFCSSDGELRGAVCITASPREEA